MTHTAGTAGTAADAGPDVRELTGSRVLVLGAGVSGPGAVRILHALGAEPVVADSRPEAYEKFVDALLASSEHGEHLARHWLDLARYADTHGYFTDHVRYMWPWRDWVIRACNANMPFDRFTVEQLAGDLLPDPTTEQRVATGFNRNHMITEETGVIVEEYRVEYVLDRVRTTGTAWLGLTVGCAQCHDHKYDPLSQREFYELFAFFNNVPESGLGENKRNSPPVLELPTAEQEQDRQRLDERLAAVEATLKSLADGETSAANSERRKALEDETADLRQRRSQLAAEIVNVMTMQELDPPRDTFVLERGQYDRPRERVRPGVPAALPAWDERWPRNRLGFARWLTAPEHPLTARVMVNRLWQSHFGRGLVENANDFGVQEPSFRSKVSTWLGPPARSTKMHWRAAALGGADCACAIHSLRKGGSRKYPPRAVAR